jgi:hypothetical protein
MTIQVHYPTKKTLRESVGQYLRYTETSFIGPEYLSTGSFPVVYRPSFNGGKGREYGAVITMQDGKIAGVK